MDSVDDIRPLLEEDEQTVNYINTEEVHECAVQNLYADPEFEQILYGYRRSRWRAVLVHLGSILTLGIPYLLFHWCPTWFLYLSSYRCNLKVADKVLVIETYQKKCKSFYIEKILMKNVTDISGLLNEGFQRDPGERETPPLHDDRATPIHLEDGTIINPPSFRYFHHKKCMFIWDEVRSSFMKLAGIECGSTCADLQRMGSAPPPPSKRTRMLNIYGLNEIKVPVQSVMALILLEVFNPFYVFQLFTIAVWLAEPYYYYCIAVVLMSTFGVTTSVIQTKKNQSALRATVEAHDAVTVWPAMTVDSRHITPGDVVVLPSNGCHMQFDAVLLNGSCIVNESMLTGESVPVTKTALLRIDKAYSLKEHSSNTLFCGTRVIQTRYYNGEPVKALVLRTGYNTSKGQLVRSILYPVPADFKFDKDSYKFIIILTFIAIIGLAYTVALKAYRELTPGDIILKALDIITIVIPPALPAAMTVGKLYAVSRLHKAKVACLNTRAVNVSGSLDAICFDKTGTLTEDGLDMWGVVSVSNNTIPAMLATPQREPRLLNELDDLKLAMATCHSLTLLNGELAGDPLDLKMFESTGWILEEPDVPEQSNYEVLIPTVVKPKKPANINVDDFHVPLEVGIVQQNQFVSSLQRSSVVTRILGENVFRLYCKGAPEMLRTLCRPETVPQNLNEVLSSYAEKGYRVIAASTKIVETTFQQLQKSTREDLEVDLEFLGLVIMENRLKPATTAIIRELKEANIHVVMITGDNIHTAVSVAKECGILASGERVVHMYTQPFGGDVNNVIYCDNTLHGVPVGKPSILRHTKSIDSGSVSDWASSGEDIENGSKIPNYKIIMNGDTWQVLRKSYPEQIGRVIERGAVFARMTSDQKQQLIVEYQALGYYVGMCGDGANDCGALRAAHTGISLSELESSVAAPFTSHDPDIVCVTRILREGRAALVTSFGVFKFMIAYSLTEFLSVGFLYYFDSNLTDFQFLFIDVALIVNFAFFFGKTEAYTGKLCSIPPLTSLLGLVPLFSLFGQMVFIGISQYLSYYAITQYPWYKRHTYIGPEDNECWENYAIFAISMFQYIVLTIVFSHGAPYRKSVLTNRQLMFSIVVMTVFSVYIVVAPAHWLAHFLQLLMPLDISMSYIILAIATIHFIFALIFERYVIQYLMEEKEMTPEFLKSKKARKTPHLLIKRQLSDSDYLNCDVMENGKENEVSR